MKTDFKPNSIDKNTQVLANYLPSGELYRAKNIEDSNLRKMLKALSYEYTRLQEKINELVEEHYLPTTVNLLDLWEKALGIPDECFSNMVSIEQRQLQIVAKLAKMNLTTEQDWIDLAALFGYEIKIEYVTYPSDYASSWKEAKFSMIVRFINFDDPQSNVFPCKFPILFDGQSNMLVCLFEKCKAADTKVIYLYRDS